MTQHNPTGKDNDGRQISLQNEILKHCRHVATEAHPTGAHLHGKVVSPSPLSTDKPVGKQKSCPPPLPSPQTRPQYSRSDIVGSSPFLRGKSSPAKLVGNQECGPPPLPLPHTRPQHSTFGTITSSLSLQRKSETATAINVSDLEDALPAVTFPPSHVRAVRVGAAPLLKQPLPRPYEKRQVTAPEQPSTSAKTPLSSLSYSSVSDTGSLDSVQPDIGPPTPSRIIGTPGKKKGKWYVVIVGRKTGIFDDWLYTHSLVSGVSGNNFLSFTSYDTAQVYYTANRDGRRVVRTSPDDAVMFGSWEEATDVNWRGY